MVKNTKIHTITIIVYNHKYRYLSNWFAVSKHVQNGNYKV